MATSKIKSIKSTLKKAIDYIINPQKTESGRLVSSFGCSIQTADIEMAMTAEKGRKLGNRKAYHLMQSFAPGEITPEEAHRLGREFADKVLDGKYEYVIATHADKEHIHNHIIFNATDFVTHKKYHHNKWDTEKIRRINDKVCKDNGYSVIEKKSGIRGKSKYEYEQSRKGNSWKDKLRVAIDEAINTSSSYEEFILHMEMEGYEFKQGKHIAFRAEGQEKFTRSERIGEFYTEESIKDRIENKDKYKEQSSKKSNIQPEKKERPKKSAKINLIVDLSKNIKAQKSKAYEHAVVTSNIDNLVKTMNFLIKNDLVYDENLENHINETQQVYNDLRRANKNSESKMNLLSEKIKFTQNYFKYKKVAEQIKKEPLGSKLYMEHESEVVQYKASLIYFEREKIDPNKLNLKSMFDEYKELKIQKDSFGKELVSTREKMKELDTVRANVESTFKIKLNIESTEKENSKKRKDIGR